MRLICDLMFATRKDPHSLSIKVFGGASPAAVAYGYSAAALFPVLAWLTKLLLDTEPDVQRRLARLSVGPAREATAGILAALVLSLAVCVAAMAAPWLFHGIDTSVALGSGIALGVLAHLLAVPPAIDRKSTRLNSSHRP